MKQLVIYAFMLIVLPVIGISYIYGPTPLQYFAPQAADIEEAGSDQRRITPFFGWIENRLPQSTRFGPQNQERISLHYRNETIDGWKQQLSEIRDAPQQWGLIGTLSSSYRSGMMFAIYTALPLPDIRQNVLFTFQLCLFLTAVFAFIRMDCKRRGGFAT